MKKLLVLLAILLFTLNNGFVSASEIHSENSALQNKEIRAQLNKIKTKRIIIANALLLNSSQKKKAREIYSSVAEKEAMLLAELKEEKAILNSIPDDKPNAEARRNQRRIIYNLQKAIADIENHVDKEFKKILTHDQKVKFNSLRKEIIISDFN